MADQMELSMVYTSNLSFIMSNKIWTSSGFIYLVIRNINTPEDMFKQAASIEDGKTAVSENIEWLKTLNPRLEKCGLDKLGKLIKRCSATDMTKELRSLSF